MPKSIQNALKGLAIGTALVAATTFSMPRPAQAQSAAELIAIGAGAIVGALLVDGNNQPYYVSNNRKYYVTQNEASYWRAHHHVVVRQAWVPENEYPVQRNAGYRIPAQQMAQQRGNQGHDDNQDNHGH
jgi:hypothetical protein